MNASSTKTVRELTLEFPEATRVFERLGIDYCCGGDKPLKEACASLNLSTQEVLESLASAQPAGAAEPESRNWQQGPLADLIAHIIGKHHRYTREEIARISPLIEKVCLVHGDRHPELHDIRASFQGLARELAQHMIKEEAVLFPYIVRMEKSIIEKKPVVPPPFGTVGNPVAMMIHEHDAAGEALRAIRQSSGEYTPPGDGCTSYQALYKALAELEADLHQHIHLENNILFPRAVEMEHVHRGGR